MATLYVSSFGGTEKGVASDIIGATTVATSGTSAATSAAVGPIVKLYSDASHYVVSGANPTATETNGSYLSAGETLWLKVPYGHKIAAITA